MTQPDYTPRDRAHVTSQFQTNSFTLSSPDLSPLGALISPHAAMANHSCIPNAVVVFPLGAGRGLEIVAIGEIGPGEEVREIEPYTSLRSSVPLFLCSSVPLSLCPSVTLSLCPTVPQLDCG
jgi:hypothetical protein